MTAPPVLYWSPSRATGVDPRDGLIHASLSCPSWWEVWTDEHLATPRAAGDGLTRASDRPDLDPS